MSAAGERSGSAPRRAEYAGPRDRLGRPLPEGSRDEMTGRTDPARVASGPDEAFERGVELFDQRRFWEAHEFFEHVWKDERCDVRDRDFWKGVTQVAVGLCHAQRGNAAGAVTLLNRAAGFLRRYPSPHRRVDTRRLEAVARRVAAEIEADGESRIRKPPRFPKTGSDPLSGVCT